ncbi:putative ribonuclease Nob1, ribonuclease, PIN domain-containing protein [Rosa chinensis]|uniref:Putative ribonuclease Nob1, ribonuclease, PIN domain-containing protein n=1 Tax=Rosa chinensis TaxID=74649 RepID=A0A2P6RLV5_ROSCH|nr:putative ribonuclease Nob1, ribonuclease, PIN domain-containing protein [Rosa chinensis]
MDATFTAAPMPDPNPNAASVSCWSNMVKKQPGLNPQNSDSSMATSKVFVESCKSSKGIAVAVVDANAIIQGGESLGHCADKFVSVPEVMDEVHDPISRRRLAVVPFQVQTMEPSPESLNKVIKFARATGDLWTLSDVDVKLIAMTYTLEAQIHGTEHLRDCPPPVHAIHNSKILPLKDINMNFIHDSESPSVHSENQEGGEGSHRRYFPKKKEIIKIEGEIVSDGIDAFQGQVDDNAGDWMPVVSPSTHRRFLRRKGKRESYEASADNISQQDAEENTSGDLLVDQTSASKFCRPVEGEMTEEKNCDEDLSSIVEQTRRDEDSIRVLQKGKEQNGVEDNDFKAGESTSDNGVNFSVEGYEMGLRLLAPGGMQIHQLHRWILKCHACNTVTAEIGRMFCPKCGNGGTLSKVAVTVGENGIILARKPRITLRGTKVSISFSYFQKLVTT